MELNNTLVELTQTYINELLESPSGSVLSDFDSFILSNINKETYINCRSIALGALNSKHNRKMTLTLSNPNKQEKSNLKSEIELCYILHEKAMQYWNTLS